MGSPIGVTSDWKPRDMIPEVDDLSMPIVHHDGSMVRVLEGILEAHRLGQIDLEKTRAIACFGMPWVDGGVPFVKRMAFMWGEDGYRAPVRTTLLASGAVASQAVETVDPRRVTYRVTPARKAFDEHAGGCGAGCRSFEEGQGEFPLLKRCAGTGCAEGKHLVGACISEVFGPTTSPES